MRKLIPITAVVLTVAAGMRGCGPMVGTFGLPAEGDGAIASAFRYHRRGIQVTGEGIVERVLPDDNVGRRHQRFILRLASDQTLMIAHNIDTAPRVYPLAIGDSIEFHGVYEWNEEGGLVHWTHRDRDGSHEAGWLRRCGRTYQ